MARFTTYITEAGWERIIKGGLLDSVKTFSLHDETLLYSVKDGNDNITFYNQGIGGSRVGNTMIPSCDFADRKSIPIQPLNSTELSVLNQRVKIAFVSEDCDVQFEKSNLTIKVNVEKWIADLLALKSVDYVKGVTGLRLDFWDYVVGYLQEYDLANSVWVDKADYKDSIDISYTLKSVKDYEKYRMVSPKFMAIQDGIKKYVNYQSKSRFSSPFMLGFKTNSVEGAGVYNTAGYLAMWTDGFGYMVDGTFWNAGEFEELVKTTGDSIYKTIYPAVKVGNEYYWLKNDISYSSPDGTAAMAYGYTNNRGETALDAITNKAKLFMKSNGVEESVGVYTIKMDFNTNLFSDTMFNQAYKNNYIGGGITFILSYNSNTLSTDVVKIT